jgi:hypothetical protein
MLILYFHNTYVKRFSAIWGRLHFVSRIGGPSLDRRSEIRMFLCASQCGLLQDTY